MKSTSERRQLILEKLSERRYDTIDNLSFEFGVSRRTMRYDLEVLSCSYPILTVKGHKGGVYIDEGFRLGKKYLTSKQTALLEKLALTLEGEDLLIINQILLTFRNPVSN